MPVIWDTRVLNHLNVFDLLGGWSKMYEFENEMERNVAIAVIVNITRTAVYFLVMLAYLQDFFEKGTPYNALNFITPAFLGMLDVTVLILCLVNRKQFWNVIPLVSIIAVLISANTMLSALQSPGVEFLEGLMFSLGLLVLLLSLVELFGWIKEEAELMRSVKMERPAGTSEFRTY